MTKKNMTEIKATLISFTANKIKISDEIVLKTTDGSSGSKKEFLVKVLKVITDIPRCNGCGIRLNNRQSYKYKTGQFCYDCYKRRRSDQREITQLSASRQKDKHKEIKNKSSLIY